MILCNFFFPQPVLLSFMMMWQKLWTELHRNTV